MNTDQNFTFMLDLIGKKIEKQSVETKKKYNFIYILYLKAVILHSVYVTF